MRRVRDFLKIPGLSDAGSWSMLGLRVVFGFFMLAGHGWRKMAGFSDIAPDFYNFLGLGGPLSLGLTVFAEVGCAGLVIAGLATRLATIPLIIAMSVAFFLVHGNDPLWDREMAMLYLVVFVTICAIGPGRFSFDQHLFGQRKG